MYQPIQSTWRRRSAGEEVERAMREIGTNKVAPAGKHRGPRGKARSRGPFKCWSFNRCRPLTSDKRVSRNQSTVLIWRALATEALPRPCLCELAGSVSAPPSPLCLGNAVAARLGLWACRQSPMETAACLASLPGLAPRPGSAICTHRDGNYHLRS